MVFAVTIFGYSKGSGQKDSFPSGKWVDLSHDYSEETPYWPTADGFKLTVDFNGMTEGGYYYAANSFCGAEHGGTHIDAPIHFARDRLTVDRIPLEQLVGEGVVLDVSENALENPDYLVSVSDLKNWEHIHGSIPEGAILLIKTGYHRYWPDRIRYMGTDERGPGAVAKLHFPGLDPEAARWLVDSRNLKAIGLDTPSIDYGQSKMFNRSGFNSPKLASFLIHKVYIKCLGACPEDLYEPSNSV